MSDAWRLRLEGMELEPVRDPGGRVVVLSAHPDDEVLAIGSWLAGHAGREMVFVTATDGEASHPDSEVVTPDDLRVRRPRELVHALAQLGITEPDIRRLGLPDGGLDAARGTLRAELGPLLKDADLVLAPYEADGHPDHDALGEMARETCPPGTPLWRFPVWTWAWTEPAEQPWLASMRELPSTPEDRDRKRRAITAFTSQVEPLGPESGDQPVVEGPLLLHASFAPEVVIV